MNYEQARPMIQSGDLIAVRSHRGGISSIVKRVTKSPYTHTAVVVRLADRVLLAEMNGGGACLVPASKYADTDFDVFTCPCERGLAVQAAFDLLGLNIDYDFGDLFLIAAHELFDVALPEADDNRWICSALSASIYLRAGVSRLGLPSIPAPRDVVAWLMSDVFLDVRR